MIDAWPELDWAKWRDTAAHLHLITQIVGKVRLALTPWLNHSWHVALYVTPNGLTTSPMPAGPGRTLQIDLNLSTSRLIVATSDEHASQCRPAAERSRHRGDGKRHAERDSRRDPVR